jgi:hypothetical protein
MYKKSLGEIMEMGEHALSTIPSSTKPIDSKEARTNDYRVKFAPRVEGVRRKLESMRRSGRDQLVNVCATIASPATMFHPYAPEQETMVSFGLNASPSVLLVGTRIRKDDMPNTCHRAYYLDSLADCVYGEEWEEGFVDLVFVEHSTEESRDILFNVVANLLLNGYFISEGGNAILHIGPCDDPAMWCVLYGVSRLFKETSVFRPKSASPISDSMYVVCKGFIEPKPKLRMGIAKLLASLLKGNCETRSVLPERLYFGMDYWSRMVMIEWKKQTETLLSMLRMIIIKRPMIKREEIEVLKAAARQRADLQGIQKKFKANFPLDTVIDTTKLMDLLDSIETIDI